MTLSTFWNTYGKMTDKSVNPSHEIPHRQCASTKACSEMLIETREQVLKYSFVWLYSIIQTQSQILKNTSILFTSFGAKNGVIFETQLNCQNQYKTCKISILSKISILPKYPCTAHVFRNLQAWELPFILCVTSNLSARQCYVGRSLNTCVKILYAVGSTLFTVSYVKIV